MDSAVEAALRTRIIHWVQERAEANGGFLHRDELLDFHIDGRKLPVIDYSRGIRNPQSFSSTLSIVSSAAARTTTSSRTTGCCTTRTGLATRGPATTGSSARR